MDKLKIEKIGTLKSEILAEFKTPETVSLYRDLPKCQKLQKNTKIPQTDFSIPDTILFCNKSIHRKLEY